MKKKGNIENFRFGVDIGGRRWVRGTDVMHFPSQKGNCSNHKN